MGALLRPKAAKVKNSPFNTIGVGASCREAQMLSLMEVGRRRLSSLARCVASQWCCDFLRGELTIIGSGRVCCAATVGYLFNSKSASKVIFLKAVLLLTEVVF